MSSSHQQPSRNPLVAAADLVLNEVNESHGAGPVQPPQPPQPEPAPSCWSAVVHVVSAVASTLTAANVIADPTSVTGTLVAYVTGNVAAAATGGTEQGCAGAVGGFVAAGGPLCMSAVCDAQYPAYGYVAGVTTGGVGAVAAGFAAKECVGYAAGVIKERKQAEERQAYGLGSMS